MHLRVRIIKSLIAANHTRLICYFYVGIGSLKRVAGLVVLGNHKYYEEDIEENSGLPPDLWGQYVSHYTVEFSPDGRVWNEIMDQQLGKRRVCIS